MSYTQDDYDTIQCEEFYTEGETLKEEYDGRNYRQHSKQSHLTGAALSKYQSRARRKKEEKARSRKRVLAERLRSQELTTRSTETGDGKGSDSTGADS